MPAHPRNNTPMSIRVAILGPTGYTGLALIEWLLRHPDARITYLASHREELPNIGEVFPRLQSAIPDDVAVCKPIDPEAIAHQADVAFLALPHRTAMQHVPPLLDAGLNVIDLSADYRLADPDLYEATYDHPHCDREHLPDAAYGLPEFFRSDIKHAKLIANPGCYPTAAALALAPLLRRGIIATQGIAISAASGVTGAGRAPAPHLHFPEQNEAFGPYGRIGMHRHQPEIEQTLTTACGEQVGLLFVPHLLPTTRGIFQTIYADPVDQDVTEENIFEAYEDHYDDEPFVRVRNDLPNTRDVNNTNFCDLTARVVRTNGAAKVVLFSTIDNLVKGAAGQAIQNMNIRFDRDETAGLI